MEKFYIDVTVRLYVEAKESVTAADVVQEMDYSFKSMTSGAEIVDTEITDLMREEEM